MSAAEELDLDDLEVPDPPDESLGLVVAMDFHMNRYRWYMSKVARKEAERDAMVERYREWCDKTTEPWRRKAAESEAFLMYAHLDAVDSDPKHPKVLHLPSGTVRFVSPRPSVVVDDPDAFRKWVEQRGDDAGELARWSCLPNKVALSKVLADGEVVAGCHLEPGERRVTVSVEDDDGDS